jgi:hypothetical protein
MPGVRLLDNMIILFFSSLRNCHIVFPIGYTNLHSHQQCTRVHFPPYLYKHLLSPTFLIIVVLTSMKLHFIVDLNCISMVISNAEHLLYTCWPFVCLPNKNTYSFAYGPLTILKCIVCNFCFVLSLLLSCVSSYLLVY